MNSSLSRKIRSSRKVCSTLKSRPSLTKHKPRSCHARESTAGQKDVPVLYQPRRRSLARFCIAGRTAIGLCNFKVVEAQHDEQGIVF